VSNKVYVANYSNMDVTIIDGITNAVSTVVAGSQPGAAAVIP